MSIDPNEYRVNEGEKVDLKKRATLGQPVWSSKAEYDALLREHVGRLSGLQRRLYAAGSHALLIVFQGMDGAGKDSAIRHVLSGVNPQGCEVHSFKQPSAEELQHDFLWRGYLRLPGRGRIGIFNRSYYEDVLVVRVHPQLLANGGPIAANRRKKLWRDRYQSIGDFERHLHRNGTRIVKFFLHLSWEEQRRRLLARIDDAEKNWKVGMSDVTERKFWKDYMKAYEECLSATTPRHAPWFVVPADDKENAHLMVSQILVATLEDMRLSFPTTGVARAQELKAIRKEVESQR